MPLPASRAACKPRVSPAASGAEQVQASIRLCVLPRRCKRPRPPLARLPVMRSGRQSRCASETAAHQARRANRPPLRSNTEMERRGRLFPRPVPAGGLPRRAHHHHVLLAARRRHHQAHQFALLQAAVSSRVSLANRSAKGPEGPRCSSRPKDTHFSANLARKTMPVAPSPKPCSRFCRTKGQFRWPAARAFRQVQCTSWRHGTFNLLRQRTLYNFPNSFDADWGTRCWKGRMLPMR